MDEAPRAQLPPPRVSDGLELGHGIHSWRTRAGHEVDFVLHGERGLVAFEIERSGRLRDEDLASLSAFRDDYPMARAYLVHPGTQGGHRGGVEIVPMAQALAGLGELLGTARSSKPPGGSRKHGH